MSERPKASAPKVPTSATPARKAATAGAPAAKSGSGSWLAGFITRAAAGIVYAVVFILCLVLGIVPTAIFVSVMSGLCCYEFFRMTRLDGKVANERLGYRCRRALSAVGVGRFAAVERPAVRFDACGWYLVCLVSAHSHL